MLLLPWRDILRQLTTSSHVNSKGTLWVTFTKGPGDLGPLFEALDLLVLFAHTEEDAWEHEVKHIWPNKSDHEWWAVLRGRDGPREIGVEVTVCRDWKEPAAALLQSIQSGAYVCSAEHQRVRQQLEGEIATRGSTTDNRSGTPRPWLSVRFPSKDRPIVSMHFVEYFTPQGPVHHNTHSLWSQVGFQLNLNFCPATSKRLRALHHAAQCAVQVTASVLELGDIDPSNVSTVEAVRWAHSPPLSTAIETPSVPCNHCFTSVRMKFLDPADTTVALLSGVQASASLTEITVFDMETTRSTLANDVAAARQRIAWRWIAYVLLSRHANPAVTQFELYMDDLTLTPANVADMRAIALTEDPLAALFEVPAVSRPDFVWASAFCLIDPSLGDPSTAILRTPAPIPVRVITMPNDDWWRVLLPGKGEAWLHERDRVDDMPTGECDDLVLINQHLHVVVAGVETDSMEPIGAMLQLLGERLRGLNVSFPSSWSDDGWCRRVLESCPHIEALELEFLSDGDMDGETVVEWYTSGVCKAASLSIINVTENAAAFVTALSDEDLALAAHVRDLRIRANLFTDRGGVMAVAEAGLHAMATNRRLHTFSMFIVVENNVLRKHDATFIEASYKAYDGELLPIRASPVGLRAKAAFLSVLSSSVGAGVQWLDSYAVATIFEFAATCRTRAVSVTVM